MSSYKIILISVFIIGGHSTFGQKPDRMLIEGDKHYRDSSFQEAEENYRKALELHPDFKTKYNIANSLYQQGRSKEAIEYYKNSLQNAGNHSQKAKAHYNLGNAYFNEKQFDKSLESYKESLKLDPNDHDARNNLMLAKEQLIQQQQQQQQQQNQQQTSPQEKDQNNKEQQPEDPKNKDERNPPQDQSQQNQQQQNQQQPKDQQHSAESSLNKEQAEQLMKMVGDQDAKIRERLQKANSKSKKRTKDW